MARPARPRHRLTGRGWLLIGCGLVAVVVGFLFGILDLVRLGLLLGVACAVAFALQWRPWPRLDLARALPRHGLHVGTPATVLLRAKGLPAGRRAFAIGEEISPTLGRSIDVPMTELTVRDSLAAASYQVLPTARGPALLGPTVVTRTDVFGLTRTTREEVAMQLVIVWPKLYPVAHRLNLGPGSGSSARQRSSRSEEDVIPRDYRAGDDYRRIHWPATARAGRLMVRSDERSLTASGTLHLALTAAPDGVTADEIVSAAASVGVALLDGGHMVAISIDGDQDAFTSWTPADRSEMLDHLACLELPQTRPADTSLAAVGDLLVLLAPASDQAALEALRTAPARRRRLAVIVGPHAGEAVAELRADGVTAISWRDVTGQDRSAGERRQPLAGAAR